MLHVGTNGQMSAAPDSVVIPAHGRLTLSTGQGHVMIEHLIGVLKPGQDVDIELDFQTAGPIDVVAPVIAVGAPAPTGSPDPGSSDHGQSNSPTPSGAHS